MEDQKPFVERLRQWPVDTKNYFQELQAEMRKVTWPSRKSVRATTLVVIVTVFLFAAYFFVVDGLITRAISKTFQVLAKQS